MLERLRGLFEHLVGLVLEHHQARLEFLGRLARRRVAVARPQLHLGGPNISQKNKNKNKKNVR